MPDKKISELVNLTSLATDDEFVVVDKGANATKRITATNLNTGLNDIPDNKLVPDGGTIGSASDPDAMAISSGGVVTFSQGIALAAGKGIDFSATADGSGTTTSELFDDYEEGSWTPTVSGSATAGSTTHTTQVGRYTKIGNFVLAYGRVTYNSATGTGTIKISGFPFSCVAATGSSNTGIVNFINGLTLNASYSSPFLLMDPGNSHVTIVQHPLAGGNTAGVAMDAAATIAFSAFYQAA